MTLGLSVPATRIAAQERTAPTAARRAILTGVAIDSIRGGYLRGASVFVSGTALSAMTDSAGRFKIEGIPAGTRIMEVQHPLLDSLTIALTTRPKVFSDGDSSFVMLSVPSARTFVASTCSAQDRAKGPALIVGTVTDGDSGNPSLKASVSVAWTDYEVSRKAIKATPHRRVVPVSDKGTFLICGLPDDLVPAVVASRGSDSTAALEPSLAALIGMVALRLPPARIAAAADSAVPAAAGTAFVSGRVVDAGGKPARAARVAIEADDAVALTGQDGAFSLTGLRPGTRLLSVRKIGHEPLEKAIDVGPEGNRQMTLTLGRSVEVLKAIVVSATRDVGLQRVGFTERKRKQSGVFISPKDIEIRNGPRLGNLLETVPILRRSCVAYFVDGHRWASGTNPDEYLSGAELGAVEVYSAGFVPAEFVNVTRAGQTCGAVVVWTKWKIDRR